MKGTQTISAGGPPLLAGSAAKPTPGCSAGRVPARARLARALPGQRPRPGSTATPDFQVEV